jgi:hypothetical protein
MAALWVYVPNDHLQNTHLLLHASPGRSIGPHRRLLHRAARVRPSFQRVKRRYEQELRELEPQVQAVLAYYGG